VPHKKQYRRKLLLNRFNPERRFDSRTRKAPGALDPAVVLPPGGVKYATVTQDKSPCLCSERHDEYLRSGAKPREKNGYY